MATKTLLTAAEYLAMPDDGYTELVRGEIVPVPPPGRPHGIVCANIARHLGNWAAEHETGLVCSNDTAVQTEFDPDTIRGADVYFESWDRVPDDRSAVGEKPPTLCVEVLSPSQRWADMLKKVSEYLEVGVDEVWVVDPVEQWVEIHTAEPSSTRLVPADVLADRPSLPGLAIPVTEFFRGLQR